MASIKRNKKLIYLAIALITIGIIVMLNDSYAYFEERVEGSCVTLEVGDVVQTLQQEVILAAGESTKIKVIVKNTDNIASKYQLVYMGNDLTNVAVGYSNKSGDLPYGDLAKNEVKHVTLILKNNGTSEKTVIIDVRGGLANNTVEDIILAEGENRITEEMQSGYNVTLVYNNGQDSEVVQVNNASELPAPTKENYNFVGWYVVESGSITEQLRPDTFAEDMTLIAKWVRLINFKFSETLRTLSFTCPEGYTWEQFIGSEYDNSEELFGEGRGFNIDANNMVVYNGIGSTRVFIYDDILAKQKKQDEIKESCIYHSNYEGGSGD